MSKPETALVMLGNRIQDRLRGWGGLRSEFQASPWCLKNECVRGADRIEELEAALSQAYRILCSGKPPHSAREANARRVLRQAGAEKDCSQ